MALERTPIDPATLSEAARKALAGPGPLKMMAARGLAPLARPVDLISVLYNLSLDAEAAIAAAAAKTLGELPDKLLLPAVADAGLDPRVLDRLAEAARSRPGIAEPILLAAATADATVAEMARWLGEKELELVAQNETRLLRHPPIIAALYLNKRTRMSTVDRAIELAARNQITVEGIPGWHDLVAAVLGEKKGATIEAAVLDAVFQQATAETEKEAQRAGGEVVEVVDAEVTPEQQAAEEAELEKKKKSIPIDRLSIPAKIRLATLGNAFARSILVRDSNKQVALAAINSPGVTDNEAVKFSANRALADDVVRVIANSKEWTKLYQVKVNLVNNPKCPLPTAMRLLPFLHDKDLRLMARSKSVPSALTQQAAKLLSAKGQKKPGGH